MNKLNNNQYTQWLEKQSLLFNASKLAQQISGKPLQWQQPYALPQTKDLTQKASTWLVIYPKSLITHTHQNMLQFLGEDTFWKIFSDIGFQVLYTGPIKLAGGIKNHEYTPSVDGGFDPIQFKINPVFGTKNQYMTAVKKALKYHAFLAADIIPGHTGKGADFLLALRNYKDYPGIYSMIEIKKSDWKLLPEVKDPWASTNLTSHQVDILTQKGYIPGHLERVLFSVPNQIEPVTGWDATAPIEGVDGKVRRWVYLHYFRAGQPTLNWLDPSFGAQRILSAEIIQNIQELGAGILRIDANPFLGIEPKPKTLNAWSENHPLSVTTTNLLANFVRKLGGWSFQELALSFDAIRDFSQYGPDLSYDFVTRPAVEHAVLTGDASFLRFCMKQAKIYGLEPNKLIHDMQNHDEITYELVHFVKHANDLFDYNGKMITGSALRDSVIKQMHKIALNPKLSYNKLSGNGLCTTFVGLIASRFGIEDIDHITEQQKTEILKAHLLLAIFNAMQPGIFSISGWDLVGALPLHEKEIPDLLKDGDCRWINRGAYDLLGAEVESAQMPKAKNLYGPLTEQLKNPNSFASQIKHLIKIRDQYQIASSQQIALPPVKNKSAVMMMHLLPNNLGYEITALNFGKKSIIETIDLNQIPEMNKCKTHQPVTNLWNNQQDSTISDLHTITIKLNPLEGKILHVTFGV
ncbi:MAG: maltose alpha-D-glucosyltransferase [Gammaproteobacteria bacterium]|nr:maltose alpha-D-glucosyltransferase [Gammaproteobacteria bacterium]